MSDIKHIFEDDKQTVVNWRRVAPFPDLKELSREERLSLANEVIQMLRNTSSDLLHESGGCVTYALECGDTVVVGTLHEDGSIELVDARRRIVGHITP